ncbi:MAG: DUF3887 domain-containing protein [Candidatus Coatesbacteria bacterium]|nr:DUF3887 domain-containing protein [Candidatus Coatesbacteria bacterium]
MDGKRMMRRRCLALGLLFLLSCLLVCCEEAEEEEEARVEVDQIAIAQQCLEARARDDFEGAMKHFDERIRKRVTPAMNREGWRMGFETAENGAFKRVIGARKAKIDGWDRVFLKCEFEKKILDIQVTFRRNGKINGMGPAPNDPSAHYEPVEEKKEGIAIYEDK